LLASAFVRRFGALLAAAVGLMNILSALYPAIPSRIELLRDLLPMHLIRASQTGTVLVGFCLILLADGLRRRRRRAMQATVILLGISAVLNLTKGLDFEEASAALILGVILIAGHAAFDIPGRLPQPRDLVQRVLTFGLLYYCYVLAGFFVLRDSVWPTPGVVSATLEPFRLLFGDPWFTYISPQAAWFERSIAVLGSIGILYAVSVVLRPLIPARVATGADIGRARDLVRRYGSDTLSYFALQDGRSYFFDVTGEAFLSYRVWGTVALVGGDPVGRADRIAPLIDSFLAYAASGGLDVCFLGVGCERASLYRRAGLRLLKVGEEAVIELPAFDAAALKRKVRRAVRHVEESGISLRCYTAASVPPAVRQQMEGISRAWVEEKGGQQGFSMTLGRLPRRSDEDCELMVAQEGEYVWGYLSFVPAYAGNGWSLDAMRRRPGAPNGLTEFLVIRSAESLRDRGYRSLSLNFATLANSAGDIDSRALDGARRFLWEHLSSVYQLKSLYQFNSKFDPVWRSRYLAYTDLLKIPKLAVAIAQTEAPIELSPVHLFRRPQ